MAVIDADAYIVETERTWEYMEEAERPFYGHNDTASELVALRKLREDGKIDPATATQCRAGNPRRLYGL